MTQQNDGGAAFPVQAWDTNGVRSHPVGRNNGMSKRDYAEIQFIAAMSHKLEGTNRHTMQGVVSDARKIADLWLAAPAKS